MSRRRRDYPDLLTTILGMSLNDIEWTEPKVSRAFVARMKAQADKVGRIIAADWINAAKERLAEVGRQVTADAVDQQRRDQQEREQHAAQAELNERLADHCDSVAIAQRLLEAVLPAALAKKHRKAMARAIKRERQRLNEAASKLAKAKVAAFKARRG
jgi:hypothetical protein